MLTGNRWFIFCIIKKKIKKIMFLKKQNLNSKIKFYMLNS